MRVLKRGLVLIISLLSAAQIYAQQSGLFGTVTDQNNSPIDRVTVKIVGTDMVTMTDERGSYHFKTLKQGKYTLQLTAIGYQQQQSEVNFENHRQLDIVLQSSQKSIEQVQVKGTSQAKKIQESGFNVNVIEAKQYANSNTDINQILNRSMGVKIREQGGLGSNFSFSINGMSGNHIKFFIDGVPIEAYGSGMSFNNI
ncbi:MAG: carboxypeptidase-like regulatory domain-containing protein, partial [Sphingobacterium sp.]